MIFFFKEFIADIHWLRTACFVDFQRHIGCADEVSCLLLSSPASQRDFISYLGNSDMIIGLFPAHL